MTLNDLQNILSSIWANLKQIKKQNCKRTKFGSIYLQMTQANK